MGEHTESVSIVSKTDDLVGNAGKLECVCVHAVSTEFWTKLRLKNS